MSAERDSLAAFVARVDPERLESLWAEYNDGPESSEMPSQVLDQHLYAALTEFDPTARMSRWLNLRLSGERATGGRIDIGIAYEIFHAFSQEFAGAAEFNSVKSGISLELAGVSRGSAVLHLVPAAENDAPVPTEGQLDVRVDPFDEVLSTITELHQTAESQGDLRRFAEHEPLVRGLRSLARTLDSHNLELELRWRSETGLHRNSRLSSSTMQYLRELWEVSLTEKEIPVSGRVVRLDLSGHFSIKAGGARNSKRYDVQVDGEQDLVDLHLELGQTVHAWVTERKKVNHLGMEQAPTYHLLQMAVDHHLFQD